MRRYATGGRGMSVTLSVRHMPEVQALLRVELVQLVRQTILDLADDEPPAVAARLRQAAETIAAAIETGLADTPPGEEDL